MKLSQMSGAHLKPVASVKPRTDLVLELWGGEGVGKTFFAANAPKPLFYQTLEARRSNDVLSKIKGDVMVGEYESDIPPGVNRTDEAAVKKYFGVQLLRFKNDLAQALKLGARTVVWDKALDLWEVIRYSHFGKLQGMMQLKYGPANSEFIDLASMPARHGATLIMINEQEEEWGNTKNASGETARGTTGNMVARAQSKTPYITDISLRLFKTVKPTKFFAEVAECKPEPGLIGAILENPSFLEIATMARPEVSWE